MVVIPNMLGQRIKRGEDPRLVSGTGAYLEDLSLPGLVHLVSVRSPHGHARIGRIDVSAARTAPGVLLVLTGTDLDLSRRQSPSAKPIADCTKSWTAPSIGSARS